MVQEEEGIEMIDVLRRHRTPGLQVGDVVPHGGENIADGSDTHRSALSSVKVIDRCGLIAIMQSLGAYSDQSLPPVAQFSRLTSVMMMSTDSGLESSVWQVTSVIALTKAFFCSSVRPSNNWTLMVGMGFPF
jgi:hypothetical protein